MEQPPTTAPPPTSTAPSAVGKHGYPDSIDSSPRSRNADSWEDPLPKGGGGAAKLRLMCSYGGHIVPRPHDKSLCYVGGDTRIVVADRSSSLSDLTSRLSKTLLGGGSFTLKYQLPNEDLDSLISVTTDEDLENMIEEYDRLAAAANAANPKSSRLRLFLFPTKPDSGSSIGSLLENSTKSEDWFLNALNGSARVFSDSSSVNCLLGLDDAVAGNENNSTVKDEPKTLTSSNSNKQDVHSVPDSPMLENSSSFGSTSSSPSLANLPPIRVHSDDQKPSAGGIEEQLSQMSVGTTVQKQEDGNFLVVASPPPVLTAPPPGVSVFHGEYTNHLVGFSDDERSDQGMPIGYRKPPQPQQYAQQLPPKTSGGFDLASPDSVSSDNSATNPLSRQRVIVYQDQIVQNSSGNPNLTDPNPRVQVQQVQETGGYVLQNQFDQTNQQNQQQFNPQQQQQQFIQVPPHFIHHHQAGAMPMPNYYPVYPQHQQQQQQQFPLYYVAARPPQGYNMPIQQQQSYVESAAAPTIVSSRPQTPPPCSVMPPPAAAAAAQASYSTSVAVPNQETAATVMYRAETGAAPARLIQVPSGQQFVGYPQSYHHPSQSVAPPPSAAATATANYAYEFADPALSQMYYSQHMSQQQQQPMAAPPQYQTVTSPSAAMVVPETSSQIPTDSTKQQPK